MPPRPYYARLTQALVTALTAPMAEGRLYEVDMRLRPSGNQGPVATSLARASATTSATEAWTWEHLALTRARVIAGPEDLASDVESFRRELMQRNRDPAAISADVQEMRDRITAAKPAAGWLDIKTGAGRMQDIELLAQTGLLLSGTAARGLLPGLEALQALGALEAPADLAALHDLYWRVQVGGRLLAPALADPDDLGEGARDFLLRVTEHGSLAELQKTLEDGRANADAAITTALKRVGDRKRDG